MESDVRDSSQKGGHHEEEKSHQEEKDRLLSEIQRELDFMHRKVHGTLCQIERLMHRLRT